MKKLLFLLVIILINQISVFCQNEKTISGYVMDNETGEKLIGAVIIDSVRTKTFESNNYGFFSFKTTREIHHLKVSYVGYKQQTLNFSCNSDTFLNITLLSNSLLDEVIVRAENPNKIHSNLHPETYNLPMKIIRQLPSIMGEKDILRSLQLLPSVQTGSEANTGLYVRGGESGDNLILLDGMEVFNANHLFGFFSVFNDDAIKSVKFYSSGYPATYNGRLASVVDLRTKDGNSTQTKVRGSLGLISSKVQIEGPIIPKKLTYVVSFRRTYLDIFPKSAVSNFTDYSNASYFFYDLNGKLNWKISEKSNLYLSNYFGKDKGFFQIDNTRGNNPPQKPEGYVQTLNRKDFNWGNNLLTLRYERIITKSLFLNASAGISSYDYEGKERNSDLVMYWQNDSLHKSSIDNTFKTNSRIKIYNVNLDIEHYSILSNHLTYGIGAKLYKFRPSLESIQNTNAGKNLSNLYSTCLYFYFQDEIKLTDRLVVKPGVNINYYKAKNISTPKFDKRLIVSYQLSKRIGLSAEYAEMTQYFQLLTLSKISLASDLWLPSYNKIKPATSMDMSLGFSFSISDGITSFMKFYKREYNNLLAYKEGFSILENYDDFSEMTASGTGISQGIEISAEKSIGTITGMISYCYSSSERKFAEINHGETFKAQYDRPHNLKLFLTTKIAKNWNVGAVFNIMSGAMLTVGSGKYGSWFMYGENPWSNVSRLSSDYSKVIVYKKNSYRVPVYHRLDLSATYTLKGEKNKSSLNFGLYNTYNAKNVYDAQLTFLGYDISTNEEVYKMTYKSLFPVIPYVSYNFEF